MPKRPPKYDPHPEDTARRRAEADRRYDQGRRKENEALARAQRIRGSKRWKSFRKSVLSRHPTCRDPFKRHGELGALATDVHHVVGLTVDPSRAFDRANCAPLCDPCHGRIEGMERAGQPTQHLFQNE
jgi:5-methylcytosine-specific restriction endonuclease McrA